MQFISYLIDRVHALIHEEKGQDFGEYMILTATVAVVIAAATIFAPGFFTDVANAVASKVVSAVNSL
jgi:UPF0716 family protein affecting phage T7 exclusion